MRGVGEIRFKRVLFCYNNHQVFLLDLITFFELHISHRAVGLGLDVGLHLHRLGHHQHITGLDRITGLDVDLEHLARHRCADVAGIALVGLFPDRLITLHRLVTDNNRTVVAVQLEVDGPGAVRLHLADGVELDDQGLARFDIQRGFLTRLQTIEEDRRRE